MWCAQVAARPTDTEALRLLGEVRLLNAEPAKSVAAYETAIALAPNDQSLITVGLIDCSQAWTRSNCNKTVVHANLWYAVCCTVQLLLQAIGSQAVDVSWLPLMLVGASPAQPCDDMLVTMCLIGMCWNCRAWSMHTLLTASKARQWITSTA